MPSVSRKQRNAMGAALHGATFPLAKALRGSMTLSQLQDFARTPSKRLPLTVKRRGR